MKKQKIISMLILIVILSLNLLTLFQVPVIAAENDKYEITLNIIYGQSEARSMLTAINEFRTGNGAWYWNQDNATKTTLTNLGELTYSYELEEIAMKRAAEIAIYFEHTRPDGTDCWSCISSGGVYSRGENIASGQPTAEQAFDSFREEDKDFDGQGHRRNMLHTNFTAIGIGHAYYNGRHYWVQEFGYTVGNATTANNSTTPVKVEILKSNITKLTKDSSIKNISVEYEGSTVLPSAIASFQTTGQWPQGPIMKASLDITWKVENEKIAKIENGRIIGVAAGTTNLVGTVKEDDIPAATRSTVNGNTITVPITVTRKSLTPATIELSENEYDYDKTAKEPVPTVILNGKVIAAENYDIEYKDNVKVGTATVSITGKGNYEGTVSTNFEITCKHVDKELRGVVAATCTTYGYTGDEYCKLCDNLLVKGSVTDPIDHTPEENYQKDDDCHKKECVGCGIIIVKENHQYGDTYQKDAENHSQECTVCGYIHSEKHKGGTATCKAKAICEVCNQEYGELNEDNHLNTELHAKIDSTCQTEGTTGDTYCKDCGALVLKGEIIPKKAHTGGTATCTSKAVCTACNQEYGELDVDNHTNIISQGRVEPTCTTGGNTGRVYCDDCNKVINEGTVIPATGHTGGTATCTSKAVCTVCNQEYGDVNSDNHINISLQGRVEPTCTVDGTTGEVHCDDCNKVIDSGTIIPATGHKGGTATCKKKAICTVCNQEYGELDADNHTNVISQGRVEPTCTVDGTTGKVHCDDCNKVIDSGTVIPATGHKGGTATCVSKAVCTVCNQEYGELNSSNHEHISTKNQIDATCTTDGETEEVSCDDCKKIITASKVIPATGHKGGTATCTSKAVCTVCNQEYGDVNSDNHVNTTTTGKIDATCTTEGATGEIYCNDCNQVVAINKVIPALGHRGGTATCKAKAICEVCNQEYGDINSSNHINIEIRDAISATLEKEGYTGDIYCLDCHELVKKGESIAIEKEVKVNEEKEKNEKSVKKKSSNPRTGDDSKIELWIILAVISSVCMVRILKWKVRKKGKRKRVL